MEPYFAAIVTEFEASGMTVSIREKDKKIKTSVESAFLKSETIWKELVLEDIVKQAGIKSNKSIKIKIEVDCEPPLGFETEEKLLLRPFSFYVKCFTCSSLFAGKMHALLFRRWKNRIKGRDWYDLEWYIKKNIPLDIEHFLHRAIDTGDWEKNSISKQQVLHLLKDKINIVSFDKVKEDVVRFIKDDKALEIWNQAYFNKLIERLKFEN